MLNKVTATFAALALALPQAASAAQEQQPAPQAPAAKKICKTQTVTGSRLAKKRVCGTADEWAEQRLQDRQAVEKVQMGPCVVNGTTCK